MIDFSALAKAKGAWQKFKENHPKFEPFMNAVKQRGVVEGTVLEINITYPDGQNIKTNLKVNETDLELFGVIKSLF